MKDETVLLARVVEHTPINIFVTDTAGRIRYVNMHAEQTLHCSRDRLYRTNIQSYIAEREEGMEWDEILTMLRNSACVDTRITLVPDEGPEFACKLNAFGILDAQGHFDGLVLMFSDITDELFTAEQIEKKNIQMARMNTELIRSNVELKKVSEMKSNFLSIASHELKTPLTSILGYSELIVETMKPRLESGLFRMVESINRAANRLHKIVNSILDVTRIEQNRLLLKPEYMDMKAIVGECLEELTQLSSNRSISFRCTFQNDLPLFFGDKIRLRQVFSNVFTNALKFSPDNSVVCIQIKFSETEGFHIITRDQGVGINKEEQEHIFDPFYEAGNPTRHTSDYSRFMGGGIGLGLSIAKGVVERHGGRIWVESLGRRQNSFPGSEFHIILPKHSRIDWTTNDSEHEFEREQSIEEEIYTLQESTEKKPKVLLVDVYDDAVEVTRMVLEPVFEVVYAEAGEAGLAAVFAEKPSVILLNPLHGTIDGIKICRIIRSLPEMYDIAVVFLSYETNEDLIRRCFIAGADDYIVKPFNNQELVEKIWRLLLKKKENESFR